MHWFVVPLNGKEEATEEEKVEWVGVDEDDRNDDGTEAGGAYTFFFDDREEEDMLGVFYDSLGELGFSSNFLKVDVGDLLGGL